MKGEEKSVEISKSGSQESVKLKAKGTAGKRCTLVDQVVFSKDTR